MNPREGPEHPLPGAKALSSSGILLMPTETKTRVVTLGKGRLEEATLLLRGRLPRHHVGACDARPTAWQHPSARHLVKLGRLSLL
jgi:hypothetical protein